MVVPISTSSAQTKRGPTAVLLPAKSGGLAKAGVALCHQLTTLDRAKLSKRVGTLTNSQMQELDLGIKVALDLS